MTTRALKAQIKNLKLMSRLSSKVQDFILLPENSWVERLNKNDCMEVGEINSDMDFFFIVKGAVEFTM